MSIPIWVMAIGIILSKDRVSAWKENGNGSTEQRFSQYTDLYVQ